jgi:uncharacterized protein
MNGPVAEPGAEPGTLDDLPGWAFVPATLAILMLGAWPGGCARMLAINASRRLPGAAMPMAAPPAAIATEQWVRGLVLVAVVVLVARFSAHPWWRRLGLTRGRLPAREYATAVLASLSLAWAVAAGLLGLLAVTGLTAASFATGHVVPAGLMPFAAPGERAMLLLGGSLLTGVSEELLFRGFLQRGLLDRWRPAAAIAVSAVLFALAHGPVRFALVLPVGLWLGWLAWRSDSVLPGIAGHVVLNAGSYLLRLIPLPVAAALTMQAPSRATVLGVTAALLGVVTIGLAAWSIARVARATRTESAAG